MALCKTARIYYKDLGSQGWILSDRVIAAKVGFRLRDLRASLKLSQKALANLVGVDDQSVSNWERGVHRPPDSVLHLLANKYNLPFDIFTEGGPMPHTLVNSAVNESGAEGVSGESSAQVQALQKVVSGLQQEVEFLLSEQAVLRADLEELQTKVDFQRSRR